MKMYRMSGLVLLAVGISLLFIGFLVPIAILIADDTPPAVRLIHPSTATGSSLTELVAYVKDPESGIESVTCSIQGIYRHLAYVSTDPFFKDEKWYLDIADITTPGNYPYAWTIMNKAGLTTTLSGTYTIYTALQGKWYINDIEITSPTQEVYSTSLTVSFKFVKTAGIADSSITCTLKESGTTLLTLTNSAANTWTGSYKFARGKHTLSLEAYDGTNTIVMSLFDFSMQTEEPWIGWNLYDIAKAVGAMMSTVGLVLVVYPFKGKEV